MPSLETIANEVKAIVSDIKSDTAGIKTNTNTIKNDAATIKTNTATIINQINQLDTDVKAGFTNLAQGTQVLIALGMQANQLLAENNKQNETVICWLTNIANTLCDIKHNTDKEVKLQTDLSATLHHMDDIGELVNAREAVDVANRYELEERMDECCPPKDDPVRPCFEQCASPKTTKFEPVRTDWKPVKFPGQTPIG
jgi:prophage DNA circulation protein